MAKVCLESYGKAVTDLPAVCLRCGAVADVQKSKTFSWFPPWVYVLLVAGLLPFAIVAMVLTKRRRVEAPMCVQHKNHWLIRQLLIILPFLLLIVGGIGAMAVMADTNAKDSILGVVCLGWVFLLVGWLVMALIVQLTSIRPQEITDTTITLAGVADEFVQAYEDEKPEAMLDDAAAERWNHPKRRPSSTPPRAAEESDRVRRRRPGGDEIRS